MLSRVLLGLAALIQAAGGAIHAAAFAKAQAVLDNTSAPAFYVNSLKALWLADSTTLISVAFMLAAIAMRPSLASRWLVAMFALFPLGTAALVYYFVGSFFAPHALIAAGLLILAASWKYSASA